VSSSGVIRMFVVYLKLIVRFVVVFVSRKNCSWLFLCMWMIV